MAKNNQKTIKNHQKQSKNGARNKKIHKMEAWAPKKTIKEDQKTIKNGQKQSQKAQKWRFRKPPPARPAPRHFCAFWDCF